MSDPVSDLYTSLVCTHCGKHFSRLASQIVGNYCSVRCYNADRSAKVLIECSFCGEKFTKYRSKVNQGPNYCSRTCMFDSVKSRRIILLCEMCGSEFEIIPNRLGRAKVCSSVCASKLRAGKAAAANYRRVVKACSHCGVEFSIVPSHIESDNLYCSRECYYSANSGDRHHRWRGGTSDRTKIRTNNRRWRRLADAIRLQRGNICEVCTATSRHKLPVHHIISWEVSKDDSPENLLVVCRSCHATLDNIYQSQGLAPYRSTFA